MLFYRKHLVNSLSRIWNDRLHDTEAERKREHDLERYEGPECTYASQGCIQEHVLSLIIQTHKRIKTYLET